MTEANIVKWDHPALSATCKQMLPGNCSRLIARMQRALMRSKTGVGLAAPQIGVTLRMILVMAKRNGPITTMINPIILQSSGEMVAESEGCLSYPGVHTSVERHEWVRVKYDNELFDPIGRTFVGFEARIVQHEIDHLDGICRVGDAWRAGKLTP